MRRYSTGNPTESGAGVDARFPRALLTRGDWIYLLSLLVPLFVYNVGLKVVRVLTQLNVPGPVGFIDQVRSDVFFNLGYALLWVGVFAFFRKGLLRWISLFLFHAATLLIAILTTSTHFFYKTTGSTLDYSFIVVSLSKFGETWTVISSETSTLHWLLLTAVLSYALAGPAIITRYLTRGRTAATRPTTSSWKAPAVACLAAFAAGVVSVFPSATDVSNTFSRDAVVNIALTELTKPDFEREIQPSLVAGNQPTEATLLPTPGTDRRNVAIVFLESTRARSATPYNEELQTTPFLKELADEGLLAEYAYTIVPHTSKALVPAVCGVDPPLDTKNTESEPGVIPARCLPHLLGEQGYRTAFFQAATETWERRSQLVDNFGHEDFFPLESMDTEGFEEANYFGYEDDIMLEPSRRWLQKEPDRPFLATYLTVTAHHDYVVPERYGEEAFVEDELLNDYLNTLRYQDFFLSNLVQQYKDLGLYEDTIFLVFGDHGEGFGEHGFFQHDNTIHNEGLRVPFVIHDPERFEGGERLETPVNLLDVLPTTADLLGYDIGNGTYPGRSMLEPGAERTLMASCYHENRCLASIQGNEKYIYYYGNQKDEFFDLARDPYEQENLISEQNPEKLAELRRELLTWRAQVTASYEKRLYGGAENSPQE